MDRRALLIALAVSLVGVLLLVLYLKRFEREASGGDKVKLLIAVKPMERGKPITEDELSTHDVPIAYLEPRAIRDVEKSKIIGLRLGTTIQAGQTLMWTDLATANEERRDLASLILPGHRGVSVMTGRQDSSAGMVKPGDYVDVLLTIAENSNGSVGSWASDSRASLVILQKVLVLASGYDTSPETADKMTKDVNTMRESVLTLSLTIDEAQKLAVANEKGSISVALRNPDDNSIANNLPRVSSTVFNRDDKVVITTTGPGAPTMVGGGRQ